MHGVALSRGIFIRISAASTQFSKPNQTENTCCGQDDYRISVDTLPMYYKQQVKGTKHRSHLFEKNAKCQMFLRKRILLKLINPHDPQAEHPFSPIFPPT